MKTESKESSQANRRRFLGAGLIAVSAAVLPWNKSVMAEEKQKLQTRIKFSAFADIHHYPGTFYSQTPEHLVQIQERAVKEQCDLIIHAGDFTHNPPKFMDFVNMYNDFKIPSYHCLGNHDQDGCAYEKSLECYRMPKGHYTFDKNGFRFIIFDPNYFCIDGVYTHYTHGNYFKAKTDMITVVPPEQVEWMKAVMSESPFPCILVSHQSIEREVGSVANWQELRKIINEVNKKHPGRIRLCINGHYHRNFLRILDNVVYFDLNSASYDWIEKTHNLYPEELCKKYSLLNHTVAYNDPVHAVITMDYDGLIKIEGMESSMLLGIDRKKAGVALTDSSGRPTEPTVLSAEMIMKY